MADDNKKIKEDNKSNESNVNNMEGQNNQNGAHNEAEEKNKDTAYVDMFVDKLKTFNDMYKTKLSMDKIASALSDSWKMLTDESAEKKEEGKKHFKALFEAVLEHSFEVERGVAYEEGRFPDYTEIAKSGNDLMRAAMFAFTDMYRNKDRKPLFDETAFGGMTADEITNLTASDGVWALDQKSDEAWQVQSMEAKNIAKGWQTKGNPYQAMIDEMDSLVEKNNKGSLDRKDVLNKLAAAEWLLVNNDDMMIKDPEDPINQTPNWNNKYWKAITKAREAIGIPKYVSMRELIQGNYAVMQKTMSNAAYHKDHVNEQIFDKQKRLDIDSMEKQSEQFIVQSAKIADNQPINEQRLNNIEMKEDKIRISVIEEDEYRKAKHAYGDVSKFIVERVNDLKVDNSINKQ